MYSIYKPEPENSKLGLERLNEDLIESIIFRKEIIFNMCKNLDCKVLYIPEILREPEYAKALKIEEPADQLRRAATASPSTQRISNMMVAPTSAVLPEGSNGGATSTTSPPSFGHATPVDFSFM